jgi:integrase
MANIRKRGLHQYQARVRLKGFPELSNTFPTRQDAVSWANQKERELLHGFNAAAQEADRLTLFEALERYSREVTPEKKGKSQELRRIWTWQKDPLAVRPLSQIRGVDLARYRDLRQGGGAGGNTIRLELALISHLYEVARKDWGLETVVNPVKAIRKPKVPKGRDRRLLEGEEELLMNYCDRKGYTRLKAVITLAIETAMRRSELTGLKWKDVDLRARMAYLHDTKNGDQRVIPLSTRAIAALELMPRTSTEWVVNWHFDVVTWQFSLACKACEIEGLRFHDLRHEATSRLFEKGLNMMEVSTITGHKSLSMLKRYTHLKPADLLGRLG